MELFIHILDRSWIHFAHAQWMAPAAVLGWLLAKYKWPNVARYNDILVPLLFIWALTMIREPLDVAHGGKTIKSLIDFAVWHGSFVVAGIWMWHLYIFFSRRMGK